jgi:hypothetical protein
MIKSAASKRRLAKLQPQAHQTTHRDIDIQPSKVLAIEKLPEKSPLRKVLLAERDVMSSSE